MKSLTEYLWFTTKKQRDLLNITEQIEEIVQRSAVREGFCLVSAMHITASIWVTTPSPASGRTSGSWWSGWRRNGRTTSITTRGRTTATRT